MYKLLIADDEPIERSTLALIVSRSFDNIEVVGEASNGREAIAMAQKLKPDIVVMDIKMPGISGIEAAKAIKASNCLAKIVIVTAYDYYDYVLDSMKTGIDDFLLKPVLKEELEASLKNVIRKIEAEDAKRRLEEDTVRKLKQLSTFLEQELISTILINPEPQQIQSYLNLLDIKFDQACGVLVSVDESRLTIPMTDNARRKVYNKRIYERVLNCLEKMGARFVSAELNNCLYILLLMDGEESDYNRKLYSLQLFGEVKACLKKEMQDNLHAGIGNAYNSVEKLYNSFFEAKIAHDHDSDTAQGLHFSDINMKIQYTRYPFEDEKKLCDKVVNGNFEEANTFLDGLVAWIVTNCPSLEKMQEKLFEIIVMITRSAAVFEHIDAKLLNTSVYWDEIRSLKSAGDIYAYMERVIREISKGIDSVRNFNMNEQVSQAAEFIKLNYQKDLSLDDVAKAVCLSPYYLSKLFKTVTGENFIDYLTRYRLSMAANLLKEGNLSVSEICYRVGYNDPNYFSKLFKKYYHMNPSDYKCNQKR